LKKLEGVIYLDTAHWSSDCTHLIVGKPNRTEKYLAAVASGCWILKPGYLEAIERDTDSHCKEEVYEWSVTDAPSSDLQALYGAAKKSRLNRERGGNGFLIEIIQFLKE
jgi:hypothetical protein